MKISLFLLFIAYAFLAFASLNDARDVKRNGKCAVKRHGSISTSSDKGKHSDPVTSQPDGSLHKPVGGSSITTGTPVVSGSSKKALDVVVPAHLAFGQNFTGDATNYGPGGSGGACGLGEPLKLPGLNMIAVGASIFGNGEGCGACLQINAGARGGVTTVYVDNKCPECNYGDDLTNDAWSALTSEGPGRIPVYSWFVPCGLKTSIGINWISRGNLYDVRLNFKGTSGAVVHAEISMGGASGGGSQWLPLTHKDSTSFVLADGGKDHDVLSQESFSIRLTNAKKTQIVCSNLNAKILGAGSGWIECPQPFQFPDT